MLHLAESLWSRIRRKGPIIFPIITGLWIILILVSPNFQDLTSPFIANNFARFLLFWILGLFTMLSFDAQRIRSWKISLYTIMIAAPVLIIYYLSVEHFSVITSPGNLIFACFAGTLLGALAGTWGNYVLQVYRDEFDD